MAFFGQMNAQPDLRRRDVHGQQQQPPPAYNRNPPYIAPQTPNSITSFHILRKSFELVLNNILTLIFFDLAAHFSLKGLDQAMANFFVKNYLLVQDALSKLQSFTFEDSKAIVSWTQQKPELDEVVELLNQLKPIAVFLVLRALWSLGVSIFRSTCIDIIVATEEETRSTRESGVKGYVESALEAVLEAPWRTLLPNIIIVRILTVLKVLMLGTLSLFILPLPYTIPQLLYLVLPCHLVTTKRMRATTAMGEAPRLLQPYWLHYTWALFCMYFIRMMFYVLTSVSTVTVDSFTAGITVEPKEFGLGTVDSWQSILWYLVLLIPNQMVARLSLATTLLLSRGNPAGGPAPHSN